MSRGYNFFFSRSSKPRSPPKPRALRRDPKTVAYGLWILADGSEVLFSRGYEAIATRRPGQPGERMQPGIRSVERIAQQHFHAGDFVDAKLHKALLQIEKNFLKGRKIKFPKNGFPREREKAPIKEAPSLKLIASGGKLIVEQKE